MSTERYVSDLPITPQDFAECGWSTALADARDGYPSMWQALSAAAREAIAEGRGAQGKVLWLLADACSMMLSPSSVNDPFKPYAVLHDRRSVIPNDLCQEDLAFFAAIALQVDDPWMKARLCDLMWLTVRPRNAAYALGAIDAYRSLALDSDTWLRGGREGWQRALGLARMLKAGAGDRLTQMEAAIVGAFEAAIASDGYLALWLADLLNANGLARDRSPMIAQRLETMGHAFDGEGDLHRARDYFAAAEQWYTRGTNPDKAVAMIVAVAEGWAKEAAAHEGFHAPSHLMAANGFENAIQVYRRVPKAKRDAYRVDERIAGLRARLNESGAKSLGEMGVIESPAQDITALVEHARKAVSGKSAQAALVAFAGLHRGVRVAEARTAVIDRTRQFPLSSFFGATMLSRDGRVIAKRPAMSLGAAPTADDEVAIRAEMVRDFGILVQIVVCGDILPALEVLQQQHRLRESDFVGLAQQSPIVPKDRATLFGKALFAGYDHDFVTALHLLVPQMEHLVRVHLRQAGATTTNIDLDGIQNENGMSTLMELPQAEQVFGEDLVFELRSLFCDAFGPNLRNELAHGLLDEDGCNSIFSVYAWWLALRLTVSAWWNASRRQAADAEDHMAVPTAQEDSPE